MRRYGFILLVLSMVAGAQSLGDAARKARENKQKTARPNERVYTNDSLSMLPGKMTSASVSNAAATPAPAEGAKKEEAKTEAAAKTGEADEAAAAEEKKKALADDITKTNAEIAQLTRELDVLTRENRLRAATYYADAGNRLRNEAAYAAQDRQYQQDIQNKQNAINAAKKKLDSLREQARRMGVPAS